jgi:hypothetical protein
VGAALGSVVAAMIAAHASATVLYRYVGAPYTEAFGPFEPGMRIEGVLGFDSPLPGNVEMQDVAALVVSYAFTDGVHPVAGDFHPHWLRVTTDDQGSIVAWDAGLLSGFTPQASYRPGSRNPPVSGTAVFDYVITTEALGGGGGVYIEATSSAPGTWTTGVPEPSAAMLVGLGLSCLSWITRRQRTA